MKSMLVNYIWASLAYQVDTRFSDNILSKSLSEEYQKPFLCLTTLITGC